MLNVVYEVRMFRHVNHVLCSFYAKVGAEVDTCSSVNTLRSEYCSAYTEEEGTCVPGVVHREGYNAFFKHCADVERSTVFIEKTAKELFNFT